MRYVLSTAKKSNTNLNQHKFLQLTAMSAPPITCNNGIYDDIMARINMTNNCIIIHLRHSKDKVFYLFITAKNLAYVGLKCGEQTADLTYARSKV